MLQKIVTAMLLMGAAALPAAADSPASPSARATSSKAPTGVSVAIDNSQDKLSDGTRVTYQIVIRNDSSKSYPHAFISQVLPATLVFEQADPEPSTTTISDVNPSGLSEVQWRRELPAHQEIAINVRASVRSGSTDVESLTTTACVLPDGNSRTLVCDTDADPLERASRLGAWLAVMVGSVLIAALGAWTILRERGFAAAPVGCPTHRTTWRVRRRH